MSSVNVMLVVLFVLIWVYLIYILVREARTASKKSAEMSGAGGKSFDDMRM